MTEVLTFQYARVTVDHEEGHTQSTPQVRLYPSITSKQYSNTPCELDRSD